MKHGLANSRLYKTWENMKQRCYNPNATKYEAYGGRGITVCEEWVSNFQDFYDWSMQNGYEEGLTIDRIKSRGNFMDTYTNYIHHDLLKVISLLMIGYTKVAEDFEGNEAVIMRVSCQLLEDLIRNIERLNGKQTGKEEPPWKTPFSYPATKKRSSFTKHLRGCGRRF